MPIAYSRCPPPEHWQKLATGLMPPEQADTALAHLEECTGCSRIVDDLLTREPIHPAAKDRILQQIEADPLTSRLRAWIDSSWTISLPPRPPEPPELLAAGRFRIEEVLGTGGMGRVYRALDTKLQRRVAIKQLLRLEPRGRRRFLREMRLHARVHHQHVATLYDVLEEGDLVFLVVEYVDGLTLLELLHRHGPLPLPEAAELIRQACLGLEAIHRHGLVHRDVKPSNLMLARDGSLKVLDLGLACAEREPHEDLTRPDQFVGTPDYAAPEQFVPGPVTAAADIFSLGVTFFRLLTDEPVPPKEGAPSASWSQRLAGSLAARQVPEAVVELIRQMLAREPEQRPRSAAEVARRLLPFTREADVARLIQPDDSQPVSAGIRASEPGPAPEPPCPAAFSSRKRWAVWLMLGGIGALLLLNLAGWFPLRKRRSEDSPPPAGTSPAAARLPAQQQAARQVLRLGGAVKLHRGPWIIRPEQLPAGAFIVQSVSFYDAGKLPPEAFDAISGFAHLQHLNVSRTSFSDHDAALLSRLVTLRWLELNYTACGDATLRRLVPLKNLEMLALKSTRITDRGLMHLRQLKKLRYLDLSKTSITGSGLSSLQTLPMLRTLLMSETKPSREGIRAICRLRHLERLELQNAQIDPDAVAELAVLKHLKELDLTGVPVAAEVEARLRRALPRCRIKIASDAHTSE